MRSSLVIFLCFGLLGCLGSPEGVVAVQDFDSDRYLGKWYEIARLDHSFERGLSAVTAEYSMREDGGIRVINSGMSAESGVREDAEGRAYFMGAETEGYLKVSFFGPFFGSYIVFELGPHYEHAFVAGNTTEYLWLLSRSPTVSDDLKAHFIAQSAALGFDTDALIFN